MNEMSGNVGWSPQVQTGGGNVRVWSAIERRRGKKHMVKESVKDPDVKSLQVLSIDWSSSGGMVGERPRHCWW